MTEAPAARGLTSAPSALRVVVPWQVVLGAAWLLCWGAVPPLDCRIIALWLPFNYLFFDAHLSVRGGARPGSYLDSSLLAIVLLRLSPVLMIFTALYLGRVGSDLWRVMQ